MTYFSTFLSWKPFLTKKILEFGIWFFFLIGIWDNLTVFFFTNKPIRVQTIFSPFTKKDSNFRFKKNDCST